MNNIKLLRLESSLSQRELAEFLNVSQATLSNWECGRYEPDQDDLKALSQKFGVSIDYLLGMTSSNSNVYNAQNIQNSNFVQGSGTVTLGEHSKEESELLRIYRELDVRRRAKLLNTAFVLEDESKQIKGK